MFKSIAEEIKKWFYEIIGYKTVRAWLRQSLTPEQYKNASLYKEEDWGRYVCSLSHALDCGFRWASMPEGFEYWNDKFEDAICSETIMDTHDGIE